ncbi:MAG TPA: glycosyltransferase family 2 protein [Jiangellaceae bacterium]|nr:glycosyltransferase family 2 protein [Jiangellaceae bacterium]
MTYQVTVVVATRNRRDELLRTLGRHEAPVIVVDNGSSDGTQEALRMLPNVTLVELDDNHGAHARTVGAQRAGTPYVAFADDDSWWAPGALERAARIMREHPRLAVLAAQVRVMPRDELDPFCRLMTDSPLGREPDLPGPSVLGFMACAAVVHRGAFLAVGGFDDIVRFPGEEERVALDLAAAGLALAYVDEVVAYHEPSPSRHSTSERKAAVTRSRVLTSMMRRPWPVVARQLASAVRSGAGDRAGVGRAVPEMWAALRHRSVIPSAVESRLGTLT